MELAVVHTLVVLDLQLIMDLYEYVNIFICSAVLALLSRNVNEESENKDK